MAEKSPIHKLQEAVVGTVSGVVTDPKGSAAKAAGQVRGMFSLGLTVAGAVAGQVADRLSGGSPAPHAEPGRPDLRVAEPPEPESPGGSEAVVTPNDVARVVAKKAPPAKKAAPSTPSDKLPPAKKAPAKKAPAKKAAAKKAPAKTTAAKTTAAKTAAAKKAPAQKTAVKKAPAEPAATEPLLDPALTKSVASEAEVGARAADVDKG